MFDLSKRASALKQRLDDAEKLNLQQRKVADEIALQRDQALNRAGAAEEKLKDATLALESVQRQYELAHANAIEAEQACEAKNAEIERLQAQLDAKDDELKAFADVHAKAEGWEQAFRDQGRTLYEVAEAAGATPSDDLVEVIRGQRALIDNLRVMLADIEELRDEAGAPSLAEVAELQPPADPVSAGSDAAAAEPDHAGEPLELERQA